MNTSIRAKAIIDIKILLLSEDIIYLVKIFITTLAEFSSLKFSPSLLVPV
jgi:hypothetical protein